MRSYSSSSYNDSSDDETVPLRNGRNYRTTNSPNNNNNNNNNDNNNNNNNNNNDSNDSSSSNSQQHSQRRVPSFKERYVVAGAMIASGSALVLCAGALLWITLGPTPTSRQQDARHGIMADPGSSSSSASSSSSLSWILWQEQQQQQLRTSFDELGRYVLEDYDAHVPFSDFLPALTGIYGKPVYAFYVNRGQGIASFGVKSKDYPMLEFNPANKAYQNTALLGFRTFIQGYRGKMPKTTGGGGGGASSPFLLEPFSPLSTRWSSRTTTASSSSTSSNHLFASAALPMPQQLQMLPKRYMYVGPNEMQIRQVDLMLGMETNVTYFCLPEEDFGAFVRRTQITNLHPRQPLTISVLDGLARMEPHGGKLRKLLNKMGRTLEAWMGVYQPYNDTIQMPFYRLSTVPKDEALVQVNEAGHYSLSFMEDSDPPRLLPIIYDINKVFGDDTLLLRPLELYTKSIEEIIRGPQYGLAKTASAFAAVDQVTLTPGATLTISSYYGQANHILDVPVIARRLGQVGFADYKLARARELVQQITTAVETKTAFPLFDGHVRQMFLDNSLRGGTPTILGEVDDVARMSQADEDPRLKVYHVFSRIHGDLERDYNDFVINPTFFSEGPGNYRDVAQNRRNDVAFNPRIGAFNVKTFLSYIQADGYNPLSVESVVFYIRDKQVCDQIATTAVGEADGHRAQREALSAILNSGPFRPGKLFLLMEEQNIELIISRQSFIDLIAAQADYSPMATYKTGYWADHWTYFMDLVESYLSIYPDQEERIMFDEQLPYFFSPATVQPRSKKYVLLDKASRRVRQLNATIDDEEKTLFQKQLIASTTNKTQSSSINANWQHSKDGSIFQSSPMEKLFLLASLKFATRDPYGMGIEYEGGRPGWDDAMNGICSLLGSGMPETYELEVLLRYILSTVEKYQRALVIPIELSNLIDAIGTAAEKRFKFPSEQVNGTVPSLLFSYWDSVASAREEYREKVRFTFSGETVTLSPIQLSALLKLWIFEIDQGVARAFAMGTNGREHSDATGVSPTYFIYSVTEWSITGEKNEQGQMYIAPKHLEVIRLPLFLEGPTRRMKTCDSEAARDMYHLVKNSSLRDEKLGMYKVSESLEGQSYDIGRIMSFASGWLENGSVWVHMSYKFYLQLIRQGLFKEFYNEMKSGGMLPFVDSTVYGRSVMECSSFIASSAFEDPSVQGRGFLARLSGSTAEFLSMWLLMMVGPNPFFVDEATGTLGMQLLPALPLWLFKDIGDGAPIISFKLFGAIEVQYHNVKRQDLFRIPPTRYEVRSRDGSIFRVDGSKIPSDLADKIRRVVFVDFIDVYFE